MEDENLKKLTLCWQCAKAIGLNKCSWAKEFKPVEGWEAVANKETKSFFVKKCPEFVSDIDRYNKRVSLDGAIDKSKFVAEWIEDVKCVSQKPIPITKRIAGESAYCERCQYFDERSSGYGEGICKIREHTKVRLTNYCEAFRLIQHLRTREGDDGRR